MCQPSCAISRYSHQHHSSFGLGEQEFVVATEGDDPGEIMRMIRRLRSAEVRTLTTCGTPIYLGRRINLDELARQLAP